MRVAKEGFGRRANHESATHDDDVGTVQHVVSGAVSAVQLKGSVQEESVHVGEGHVG